MVGGDDGSTGSSRNGQTLGKSASAVVVRKTKSADSGILFAIQTIQRSGGGAAGDVFGVFLKIFDSIAATIYNNIIWLQAIAIAQIFGIGAKGKSNTGKSGNSTDVGGVI